MRKTIFMLGMVLISLQLPFCPYRFLSNEWVNRLELGRKFLVPIVLQAYGVTDPVQAKEPPVEAPKGIVYTQVNYSLPEQDCSKSAHIVR